VTKSRKKAQTNTSKMLRKRIRKECESESDDEESSEDHNNIEHDQEERFTRIIFNSNID